MSMDTGGLAHMTYNMSLNGGSLGVPGSGFASRGKGSHIKRLSVSHQPDDSSRPQPSAGPRTSRSHLLAGLRTAPKTPSTPATAPIYSRMNGGGSGQDGARRGAHSVHYPGNAPHTAAAGAFSNTSANKDYHPASSNRQMYSLPEHVLAPPPIDFNIDENGEPIDESLYSELVSANLYLAAQQQRLQQQLASVTAAAQQFQNMNIGTQQQMLSPGVQTPMSFYQQQAQQGMQPVVQAVPGQPGVYSVYNPMTGQQNFVMDEGMRQEELAALNSPQEPQQVGQSPFDFAGPFRTSEPSLPEQRRSPVHNHQQRQSHSPTRTDPASTQQQQQRHQEITPLPTPMSAGFKRNHKKHGSMAIKVGTDVGRNGTPRSGAFPPTPATGTFGPGQARAGEHPVRQPRGPPSLEELVAKPTSKYEGSKNFVTRQRRRAVHNLVRAGMERRGGQSSSGGSLTPSSESDFNFSPTDGEETGNQSASVSSHPSIGSLRGGVSTGAIGSERKEKDGGSRSYDNTYSPTEISGVYGEEFGAAKANLAPTAADIVAGRNGTSAANNDQPGQRRRMPRFVLSSAEKRKTPNQ